MKLSIIRPTGFSILGQAKGALTSKYERQVQIEPVGNTVESKTSYNLFCDQFREENACTFENYIACLVAKREKYTLKFSFVAQFTMSRSLSLTLNFEWRKDTQKFVFRLEGSVLQGLKDTFGDNINVQLEIKKPYIWDSTRRTDSLSAVSVLSKEMPICTSTTHGYFCEDDNMEVPKPWKLFVNGIENMPNIGLWGDIEVNICFKPGLFPDPSSRGTSTTTSTTVLSDVVKKILDEKIETDMTIVAMNEAEIKCHKSFLSAQSPVFAAMFRNDCQERSTSRIELVEMSEEAVNSFLAYLYHGDLTQANESSVIAFDLFEAGHKYEVQSLEEDAKRILLQKPNEWMDVNVALRIFSVYGKLEEFEHLKTRAIQVMKAKRKELEDSDDYKKLFQTDPTTAMELFKAFTA